MSTTTVPQETSRQQMYVFWGCFAALVTTAFAFIGRTFLIATWQKDFGLDSAEAGRLLGIGIWPFAVSIIGFSLFIDSIGYRTAMILAFLGHMTWAVLGASAYFVQDKGTAFQMVYWGSLVVALANGAVEAFINPVVATMFDKEKTKWLNILHAGWPAGLVVAGIVTIFMTPAAGAGVQDAWWLKVAIIALPALLYFGMLVTCQLPVNERVSSGVSYKEMLAEFGILGAIVVAVLVTLQLADFFYGANPVPPTQKYLFLGIGVAMVVAFGAYTQAIGRPLMFVLILLMIPLATTEIGTDATLTPIMETVARTNANPFHPGWVLVYTSAIMMILRFFAGPIVHLLSPLGLLAASCVLAILGLKYLSTATGLTIFGIATLYGVGKTFFWPTMLGVVSEQCPKGGALTLNAISGIGMLAAGTLGTPYIGTLRVASEIRAMENPIVEAALPSVLTEGKLNILEDRSLYQILNYKGISETKLEEAIVRVENDDERQTARDRVKKVRDESQQKVLAKMVRFPLVMLIGYIGLIVYFRSRGGYRPVHLSEGEGRA